MHTDRLGQLPVTLSTRAGYLAAPLLWDDAWALWQSKAPGRELRGALVCVCLCDADLRSLVFDLAPGADYDAGFLGDRLYGAISTMRGDPRAAPDVLLRTCKAEHAARQAALAQAQAKAVEAAAPATRPGFDYDKEGMVGVRVPALAQPVPAPAPASSAQPPQPASTPTPEPDHTPPQP